MRIISETIVKKTIKSIANMSVLEAHELMTAMCIFHPYIFDYLMDEIKRNLNKAEQEFFLYLGVEIWRMMIYKKNNNRSITVDILYETEELHMSLMVDLISKNNMPIHEKILEEMKNSQQEEVIKYIVSQLFINNCDENDIRSEKKITMFVKLKTIIDCLDRQISNHSSQSFA